MFKLYEALTEGIPAEEKVSLAIRGRWQGYVETEMGASASSLLLTHGRPYADSERISAWEGRPLRDLAAQAAGDDPVLAALGVAAMNAWYNRLPTLRSLGAELWTE